MKIHPINQNNNVSHKAYFKKNDLFDAFVKNSGYEPVNKKLIRQFKNLPDHKLEIIGIRSTLDYLYCNIFNFNTSGLQNFKIKKEGMVLNNLLETFCKEVKPTFFRR